MSSYFSKVSSTENKVPPTPVSTPRSHLMVRGNRRPARGSSHTTRPKNKGRKQPRKARSMADMTLRDAADLTGALIRGGVKIATAIFNVEEKIWDTSQTGIGSTIQCLTQITQGADYNQREGLSIKARNLVLNINCRPNVTAVYNFLRLVVFQDLENRGVAPTLAEVFESTTTLLNPLSCYNHILAERFRVLLDEKITLVAAQQAYFARFVMPLDTHILFQSNAGSVAAQYEGSTYLFLIDSEAVNQATTSYYSRLTYVDN